ncbi:MAG: Ni/Fe hydrogenase subunit gamma [Desulfobacteraceae bacterium]|nr:MAG: Ni/Fe hydrogenase subunit gamma [Desulfobacteraceae bacterium]
MKRESTEFKIAQLVEVTPETGDTSTYLFVLEAEPEFLFEPGQFNMLGLPGLEEAPISMSSLAVPGNNLFAHTIRHVGNVTNHISRLNPGDRLLVRGPFGRGWPVDNLQGEDVLVVAGGIGLAPLRPFLLHCLNHREDIGRFILVYGARTPEDMIFRHDLLAWQESGSMKTVFCVDRLTQAQGGPLQIRQGLVTSFLGELNLDPLRTRNYVCGPEIMMRFVARGLLRDGHARNRIHVTMERRMRCGTAHCGHCQIGPKFVCQDGPVFEYGDIARFADVLL